MGSFGGIPGPGARLLSNKKSAFESFEMKNLPTRKHLNKSKSSGKRKSPKLDKSDKKKKSPKPEKRKSVPAMNTSESGKNNLKTRLRRKTFSVVYFKRVVKKDKQDNSSSAASSDGKGEEGKPFIRKSPRLVIKSVARKAKLSRSGDDSPKQCDSPKLTKSHRVSMPKHCDSPELTRSSHLNSTKQYDSPKLTTKLHCQNSPQLERSLNFERSRELTNSVNRQKLCSNTSNKNGHNNRRKPPSFTDVSREKSPKSQNNSSLSPPSINLNSLARDKLPKHSTPNPHKSPSLSTTPGSSPSRSPIASGRSSPVFGSLSPIINTRSTRSSPTFSTKSTPTSPDLLSPTEAKVYYELVRDSASFNEPWDFDEHMRLIPGTSPSKGIKRDRSPKIARSESTKKIKN